MPQKILFKRGKLESLPKLDVGEPAFTVDTNGFYIGGVDENVQLALQKTVDAIKKSKESYIVNVKDYGVKGDGVEDETTAIQQILDAYSGHTIYFPAGEYKANLIVKDTNTTIRGDGREATTIIGVDSDKPVINGNGKLYLTFDGLTLEQIYNSPKPILDITDCRYVQILNTRIMQASSDDGTYLYTADGVDMRNINNTWVGYNRIYNSQILWCKNGIVTGPNLNSVLSITDSVTAYCGYFGMRLEGVSVCIISNMDVARCGMLRPDDVYNPAMYGGIYAKCNHTYITGVWCEYNAPMGKNMMDNNIYYHPECENVTFAGDRNARTNNNVHHIHLTEGLNQNIHFSDTALDDGMGKERYYNLIANGEFRHWDKDKPTGWEVFGTPDLYRTYDVPKGYGSGLRISNPVNNTVVYQDFGKNNLIEDISRYVGKCVTLTLWIKAPLTTEIRVGFLTGTGYFPNENFQVATLDNEFFKIVSTYTINGDESRLAFGCAVYGPGEVVISGIACCMSPRVCDSVPKPITEDGGNIMNQEFKIGGKRHGYSATKPSNTDLKYNKGDIVYNVDPASGDYIGWVCTAKYSDSVTWKGFGIIE